MDQNSKAILILCSHLCVGENMKPFEPAEWARLAEKLLNKNITPHEVLSFSNDDFKSKLNFGSDEIERINRLIGRSGSIVFEVERYASMGINIMTRADKFYPKVLKQKLGKSCPPIFYYAGTPSLTEKKCIGFVGSRNIDIEDGQFTILTVEKSISKGLAVVSGGANGVDTVSQTASIGNGGFCIEYISDSLVNRIKKKNTVSAVLNNQLVIMSVAKPDAGFSAGIAMMRNKYIYSQSDGTVVIRSDYNKGGTWNGAIENIKYKRSATFCWNNPRYIGNTELINRGAIPIDEEWDVDVSANNVFHTPDGATEQLSFFTV